MYQGDGTDGRGVAERGAHHVELHRGVGAQRLTEHDQGCNGSISGTVADVVATLNSEHDRVQF